jgi:hypothetical protein
MPLSPFRRRFLERLAARLAGGEPPLQVGDEAFSGIRLRLAFGALGVIKPKVFRASGDVRIAARARALSATSLATLAPASDMGLSAS